MGMYDTIIGECPVCGDEFEAQTTLGECLLRELTVGDEFEFSFEHHGDMRIVLKDRCVNGHSILMVINDGRIEQFRKFDGLYDVKEKSWGNVETKGDNGMDMKKKEKLIEIVEEAFEKWEKVVREQFHLDEVITEEPSRLIDDVKFRDWKFYEDNEFEYAHVNDSKGKTISRRVSEDVLKLLACAPEAFRALENLVECVEENMICDDEVREVLDPAIQIIIDAGLGPDIGK